MTKEDKRRSAQWTCAAHLNPQCSLHIYLSQNNYLKKRKKRKLLASAGFQCLMLPLEAVWGGNGPQVLVHTKRGQTDTKHCDRVLWSWKANLLIELSRKTMQSNYRWWGSVGSTGAPDGTETKRCRPPCNKKVLRVVAQQQQCSDKHSNISRDVNQDITLSRHLPSSRSWLRQQFAWSTS